MEKKTSKKAQFQMPPQKQAPTQKFRSFSNQKSKKNLL